MGTKQSMAVGLPFQHLPIDVGGLDGRPEYNITII
jgi:hypothetical protein